MNSPEHLTNQLSDWLNRVDSAAIPRDRKRDMVVFLDRVVEVVEQAFREVFRVCIALKYISEDLSVARVTGLRMELDSLRARDKYRDVEFICGRLHVLRQQFHHAGFDQFTRDIGADFRQLVYLIDDREGEIMRIAGEFLWQTERSLQKLLDGATSGSVDSALADTIARDAQSNSESLARVLADLNALHTRILGSVGVGGLLDLFLQRDTNPQVQVDARQLHVGGDYVRGSQTKAGRDINRAGRDIVRGVSKEPASIEDARALLLAGLNNLPSDRRAVIGKQIDGLIDDIQRKVAPSVIQEKAAAIEKMLDSGKKVLGAPAKAAWKFLKKIAGGS